MKKDKGRKSSVQSQKEINPAILEYGKDNKKVKLYGYLIFSIAFLAYIYSIFNGYALDDFIVIIKNSFTQKGFAGIADIFSKDTFAGMVEDNIMGLSGGRYRPLSVVTFAIEHQFFGNNAGISHLINVIINAVNCVLLFKLLLKFKTDIPASSWINISLFTSLLFTLLPSHSEPVINIKGRDDLMSLMFFLLASLQLFKYISNNNKSNLIYSSLFFFLSLLSKEIAVTFTVVFPLLLYFFTGASKNKIRETSIIFLLSALVFGALRYMATKNNNGTAAEELLNNPFIYASTAEKFATVIYMSLLYFKLLLFPIHLSYDYNFNQLPLVNFFDWHVWLSVFIHLSLIVLALISFKRKSVYSFAILFYFIVFSIVSNFFFNIGTLFADRFVYIPSIGYCLIVIITGYYLIQQFKEKINISILNKISVGIFAIISTLYLVRIVDRIPDWKNNNTLFLADTDDAPQSVKVQINACLAYLDFAKDITGKEKDSILDLSIPHLEKAISIYPAYVTSYLNMGVVYNWKGDFTKAEYWWNKAREIKPGNSKLAEYDKVLALHYFDIGMKLGSEKKTAEAIVELLHGLKYDSTNVDLFYNLGGAYYTIQKFDSASYFWKRTLQINPNDQRVKQAMLALPPMYK